MNRHKGLKLLGWLVGFTLVVTGIAACNASNGPSTSSTPAVTHSQSTAPAPKPKPTPTYTVSQENAIRTAKGYLQYQAFSKKGLIQQLTSKYADHFPRADARFAVNHLKVNWFREAVKAAKGYLKTQGFSHDGLVQQLQSKYGDQFTHRQAEYAAHAVGLG